MRVHELAKELGVSSKTVMDLLASMKIPLKSHSSTLDEATVDRVRRHVKGRAEPKPEPARVAPPPSGEPILGMRKIIPPPPPPQPILAHTPAAAHPPHPTTQSRTARARPPAPVDPVAPSAGAPAPAPSPMVMAPKERPPKIKERLPPPPPPDPVAPPPVVPAEIDIAGPLTVGELAAKLGLSGGDVVKRLLEQRVLAGINQQITVDVAAEIPESLGSQGHEPEPAAPAPAAAAPKRLGIARDATAARRPPVVTIIAHVDHAQR